MGRRRPMIPEASGAISLDASQAGTPPAFFVPQGVTGGSGRLMQPMPQCSADGQAAGGQQDAEVNDGGQVGQMPEQDAQAVALQEADREQQQRQGRQGVAERDEPQRRHEQTGAEDQRGIIQGAGQAGGGQTLQAAGA